MAGPPGSARERGRSAGSVPAIHEPVSVMVPRDAFFTVCVMSNEKHDIGMTCI